MNDIKMCVRMRVNGVVGVDNDEHEMMSNMLRLSSRFTRVKFVLFFALFKKLYNNNKNT